MGTNTCSQTAMSFWSIVSCAMAWKRAISSAAIVVRFRSFEDDLLDDRQVAGEGHLLANTGLPLLEQPIREHLAALWNSSLKTV